MAEEAEVSSAISEQDVTSSPLRKERVTRCPSILLVGKCLIRETGNAATLNRLRSHVESGGYDCVMIDPEDPREQEVTQESLRDLIQGRNVVSAVGLHLYRSASILLACKELGVPYICYFGGTDMNEGVKSPEKREIMTEVVFGARHLIAFTEAMKEIALAVWPFLKEDAIRVVPQAITVNPNTEFDFELYISSLSSHKNEKEDLDSEASKRPENNNSYSYNETIENEEDSERKQEINDRLLQKDESVESLPSSTASRCPSCKSFRSFRMEDFRKPLPQKYCPLVVLVAGLRPVKDVLYVADCWSQWQQDRGGEGCLLIIGPVLDAHYAKDVKTRVSRLHGVLVADKVDPSDCQEIMRNATALINTSISEGMSAAILEAMALGTPVIARDIPGNAAIVNHQVNGLLFNSPEDFLLQLQRLLQEPELPRNLAERAKEYLHRYHCAEVERRAFLDSLSEAIFT
ncbi:glycosyltransferase 1 domain-containing protein 1-like [Macrobrachium rosenbergii]|uniref:glycosyltransferase 1 domain-containing protein 1-like n=1 Tax=Macrobrachium rosenbergii TaxID=79674 RepID=UPI0034D41456